MADLVWTDLGWSCIKSCFRYLLSTLFEDQWETGELENDPFGERESKTIVDIGHCASFAWFVQSEQAKSDKDSGFFTLVAGVE